MDRGARPRRHPFALLPLQQGYFVGQLGGWELSYATAHFTADTSLSEVEADEVTEDLAAALRRLVTHQPGLRYRVTADGMQQVLPAGDPATEVPLTVVDLRDSTPQQARDGVDRVRQEMAACGPDPATGPTLEVRLVLLPEDAGRLYLSCSLLAVDGWSFAVLVRELLTFCADPNAVLLPLEIDLGDYVEAVERLRATPDREQRGELVTGFSVVEELFADGFIDTLVNDVVSRARALAAGTGWDEVPALPAPVTSHGIKALIPERQVLSVAEHQWQLEPRLATDTPHLVELAWGAVDAHGFGAVARERDRPARCTASDVEDRLAGDVTKDLQLSLRPAPPTPGQALGRSLPYLMLDGEAIPDATVDCNVLGLGGGRARPKTSGDGEIRQCHIGSHVAITSLVLPKLTANCYPYLMVSTAVVMRVVDSTLSTFAVCLGMSVTSSSRHQPTRAQRQLSRRTPTELCKRYLAHPPPSHCRHDLPSRQP